MNYDYLIKNGKIIDGSGSPAFEGSLAIKDGRIAEILNNQDDITALEKNCKKVIDALGLMVCPGFIDMHSHADWVLPLPDHPTTLAPLLEQGITTVVGGNCGYSTAPLAPSSLYLDLVASESEFLADKPLNFEWSSMASFFEHLEQKGLALNLAMLAGHGNLRLSMFGQPDVCPGEQGFAEMAWTAGEALKEGACGISLGLGYSPGIFSDISELEKLAICAREHDRLLTVHLKAYTKLSGAYPLKLVGNRPHNIRALEEMIDLARRTGVKMQISHLLFVGRSTWPLADRCLGLIENAVAEGRVAQGCDSHDEALAFVIRQHPPEGKEISPRKPQLRNLVVEITVNQNRIETLVARRHRRMGGKHAGRPDVLGGLGVAELLILNEVSHTLDAQKPGMPFIDVIDRRPQPQSMQSTHATDPKDDLLPDAHVLVSTIQHRCYLAVLAGVLGNVRVQQVQRHSADHYLPYRDLDRRVVDIDGNTELLIIRPFHHLHRHLVPVILFVSLLLPAVTGEYLTEVPVAIEQPNPNKRDPRISGRLQGIARKHSQPP